MMKEKSVSSLEEMISLARELGVRMIACETSRHVMGIKESELVDGLEYDGVASSPIHRSHAPPSLFDASNQELLSAGTAFRSILQDPLRTANR